MPTLKFEPGAAAPIRLRFRNPDRTLKDTTGWTLQLRVNLETGRVIIPSVRAASGEFVIDANAITLPARQLPYVAVIDIDHGEGWRRQGQVALAILEAF